MTAAPPMPAASHEFDVQIMRRAIRLAMNGRGRVEPNPMVGCVIVKNGRIIGEGYHTHFGGPHAEPNALANCTEPPAGATAYVTLEPCCHTNKKTPPCVPALVAAKLARVVIGCLDPTPQVNGSGAAQLRQAGIEVTTPVLEAEAKQLICLFASRTLQRPYVTLKWAESADGKVAGPGGAPLPITGRDSQRLVHELRSRVDGILIGVNTILTDDPLLNARHAQHPSHPFRYILDTSLRTPPSAAALHGDGGRTTIFHGHDTTESFRQRRNALEAAGASIMAVPRGQDRRLELFGILSRIRHQFVDELLVEPGPTLAASFMAVGAVDRLWVFRAGRKIESPTAPAALPVPENYLKTGQIDIAGDLLTEYLNPASSLYFAPTPSADFILARDQAHSHLEQT